jgi:peptidoglycan/LPS O-acetylase OafA/YrhL
LRPEGLFAERFERWLFGIDGWSAVMHFFVISGFLMNYVLANNMMIVPLRFRAPSSQQDRAVNGLPALAGTGPGTVSGCHSAHLDMPDLRR